MHYAIFYLNNILNTTINSPRHEIIIFAIYSVLYLWHSTFFQCNEHMLE